MESAKEILRKDCSELFHKINGTLFKNFQELIKFNHIENQTLGIFKELLFEDLPNIGYHYSIFPALL